MITRDGYVYIMHISSENRIWEHRGELYKIGQTCNPKTRLQSVSCAFGDASLIAAVFVADRIKTESMLHKKHRACSCSHPFGVLNSYTEYYLFNDAELAIALQYLLQFETTQIKRHGLYIKREITPEIENRDSYGIKALQAKYQDVKKT